MQAETLNSVKPAWPFVIGSGQFSQHIHYMNLLVSLIRKCRAVASIRQTEALVIAFFRFLRHFFRLTP